MPHAAPNPQTPPRTLISARSPFTRALRTLGAPKLGMTFVILLALYSAVGAMPIGPFLAERFHLHPADTLRALPAIDLSEQQWFATPIFIALVILIALSLLAATLTRLPIHTRAIPGWLLHLGGAVLCLGAAIYAPLKQEGAILLPAPIVESTGPLITHFLADSQPTLLLRIDDADPITIPLDNLPLYTDHATPWNERTLNIPLPDIAEGITARITGYARAAEPVTLLVEAEPGESIRAWSVDISPNAHPERHRTITLSPSQPPVTIEGIHLEALIPSDITNAQHLAAELPRGTPSALSVRMHAVTTIATTSTPAHLGPVSVAIAETFTPAESRAIWGSDLGPVAIARVTASDQPPISAIVTSSGILHSDAPLPDTLRIELLHAGNWRATFIGSTVIVRAPDATVRTMSAVAPGGSITLADHATIHLVKSFSQMRADASISQLDPPDPLLGAAADRSRSAVRLTITTDDDEISRWIPFARLAEHESTIPLPDGSAITVSYQPARIPLPQDLSFALISSEPEYLRGGRVLHNLGAEVEIAQSGVPTQTAVITLTKPLDISRNDSWWRTLTGDRWRLSIGAWDAEGWERSKALAEMGVLTEPSTRFVVLRIGDAPGIRIIALGGALIALGAVTGFVRTLVRGVRG